ncbi:MAG: dCTP deaminase [Gemmatimonadetes bacterium]|nr:dCTP deaminase [Gemmatimonadota bacterium]
MTIKNDRWIRRMAEEQGMIDPFEPGQVRKGTISYGLSSYGYDIRVASEFKVFTNVHSVVVDPKVFDQRSFVDVQGSECIVPPNSFALARTVEFFRVPRDTLVLCVGKSTYARCFSGDTRVALVDGSAPTLEEMARRSADGEMFWGYSLDRFGRVIVSLLDAPRFVGTDPLIELTLDDGAVIRCTPDHEFVRRDGRVDAAAGLRPGDSLMPLYRALARGYEVVYQPLNGNLYPTHCLADEWNLANLVYDEVPGTHHHHHHRDHDRRNNNPWNVERMPASDHIRHHNEQTYGEEFDPDEHSVSIRRALRRLSQDPEWKAGFSRLQRSRANGFWNEEKYAEARVQLREGQVASWTPLRRSHAQQRMTEFYRNAANRRWQSEKSPRAWENASPERREQQREIAHSGPRNHRIIGVRDLPGVHDVFCLTVPEAGNFALDAGVFTLNCGIIVNVTPLEPTWRGYLTIEISNTTPLPAKIYANEGIAQLLFFQSDEEPEVAYEDRGGKYQDQKGVTLPKL